MRRTPQRIASLAVVVAITALSYGTYAQVLDQVATQETCSFFGESLPEKVITFASDNEAEAVIARIMEQSGLPQNFQIRAAGVPNAAAVIQGNQRYILYNQHFIRETRRQTGNAWAPISIMAHEVGHHLSGHTLSGQGSRPKIELEADYYSGFVLQKMGASLEDARAAMSSLGSPTGSSTHPARHDRLAAITNGWMKACAADSSCDKNGASTSEAPARTPRAEQPDRDPQPQQRQTQRPQTRPPVAQPRPGLVPGHIMQPCGCWGFNPTTVAPEPRCQSGQVELRTCSGGCQGGGHPYGYVCR